MAVVPMPCPQPVCLGLAQLLTVCRRTNSGSPAYRTPPDPSAVGPSWRWTLTPSRLTGIPWRKRWLPMRWAVSLPSPSL